MALGEVSVAARDVVPRRPSPRGGPRGTLTDLVVRQNA